MKKILTLLCLALALTLICGAAMAEGIAAPTHEHVYDYTDPIYGDLPACGGNEQTKVWFECTDETCTELEFYPLFPLEHVFPAFENGSVITYAQYLAIKNDGYVEADYTEPYCDARGGVTFYCKHHRGVLPYKEGGLWKASAACNQTVTYIIEKLAEDGQHTQGVLNEDPELTYAGVHTTAGQNTYKCAVCSNEEAFKVPVPAPGHIYTKPYTAINNPTCTEPSLVSRQCEYVYPDGTQCDVCDEVVIDARGHDFPFAAGAVPTVEEVNAVDTTVYTKSNYQAPTCEDVGSVTFKCSRCPVTQENDVKELGHDWDTEENAVIEEAATCIADGTAYLPCKRQDCNGRNYVDAPAVPKDTVNGHNWGDDKQIREAKCYQTGYIEQFCNLCKTYKYVKVDTLPHTWDNEDGVVDTPATCSSTGVAYRTCQVPECGKREEVTIDKDENNHDPQKCELDPDESQAATCTEDGWNTYHCNACGRDFVEVLPHPVGGHALGDPVYDKEISCTEAHVGVRYCQNPGCTYSEEYIDPNHNRPAHDWTDWARAANEDNQVTWFRQCKRCGEAEEFISKEGIVPCDEHEWNDGVVLEGDEPTIDKEGKKTFTCIVCGQTKTEKIPKLEPEPVDPLEITVVVDTLTADQAVITYTVTGGDLKKGDLRVQYYILNQDNTYTGGNYKVDIEGDTLDYTLNGAFGFVWRLYDANTGKTYGREIGVIF